MALLSRDAEDALWTAVEVVSGMAAVYFFYEQLKPKKSDPALLRIDRRLAQLAPLPEDNP